MATQVIGAAGAALGGPVGATVGSFLGRQVDRSFGRAPQARLSDLRFPSSQYGDPIPAVRGRMRVGGLVLWSGAPTATATVNKNGTGQGSSVSFALALASGRVDRVDRIWADGRLIRDGEGRQDVSFAMRLHGGDEDQLSDPLIASVLGEERAPAFRGIAYLVFEDFDLSSFGNRLPVITAEISGDERSLTAEQIICGNLEIGRPGGGEHGLVGFAAGGDDQASALAPLVQAFSPKFSQGGKGWMMDSAPTRHSIDERLWYLDRDRVIAGAPDADGGPPTRVSLRYFDPEGDFAASEKSARLPGRERLRRIEVPAAMTGEGAKTAAFEQLLHARESAEQLWLRLPLSFASIRLGDELSCSAETQDFFAVCEKVLTKGELKLRLKRKSEPMPALLADSGGVTRTMALIRQPLRLSLVELPGGMSDSGSLVAMGVSGGSVPFEALPLTVEAGGTEQQLLSQGTPSPRGTLLSPLSPAHPDMIDRQHRIHLQFEQDPVLTSCSEAALLGGANLLCVDGEFIQYALAEPLGDASYQLSDLLRGRFDSATSTPHAPGASVILLQPEAMRTIQVPRESIGAKLSARVQGPDGAVSEDDLIVTSRALRPWAPSHLHVHEKGGAVHLSWTRRCKEGVPWLDDVDAPLGASRELYMIVLRGSSGYEISRETSTPSVNFDAQVLVALGSRPWQVEIRQMGDFAAGNPCFHSIF